MYMYTRMYNCRQYCFDLSGLVSAVIYTYVDLNNLLIDMYIYICITADSTVSTFRVSSVQ